MPGKHLFPVFLVPQAGLSALTQAHANHIENAGEAIASLNLESKYKKQFPSQMQQHYWDYYLAVGNRRRIRNRYVEVHPGLVPEQLNSKVIDGMLRKVNWLKGKIQSGDLPETDGQFIWARAGGNSYLSRQEQLILAENGLSVPKRRVKV